MPASSAGVKSSSARIRSISSATSAAENLRSYSMVGGAHTVAVTNLPQGRVKAMTVTHVLNLAWVVICVTGFVVGLTFIARDWLRRRARRRLAVEALHAANDNQRDRRRARR